MEKENKSFHLETKDNLSLVNTCFPNKSADVQKGTATTEKHTRQIAGK